MIGKIIGVLITGGVGTIIAVMGWLIWKKEKLSLMHDYHVRSRYHYCCYGLVDLEKRKTFPNA